MEWVKGISFAWDVKIIEEREEKKKEFEQEFKIKKKSDMGFEE